MAVRPGLAVILPPSPPPESPSGESFQQSASQSTRDDDLRGRQRSSKNRATNHVRARPAKPAVISSILSSFEALTPPPTIQTDDYYSETGSMGSKRSRHDSSDGTLPSLHSLNSMVRLPTSPGFGMEYGRSAALAEDVDGEYSEAALPPSIRTSRDPSGWTKHVTPSPSQSTLSRTAYIQTATIVAQRPSSLHPNAGSEVSRGSPWSDTKSRLSAANWIEGLPRGEDSLPTPRSSKSERSLRRVRSRETLKAPVVADIPLPASATDPHILSRAERIIAQSPSPLADRQTWLLTKDDPSKDTHVDGDSPVSFVDISRKTTRSEERSPTSSSDKITSNSGTPLRWSPQKGPIGDSIPTRTSSLRQASSSPGRRRTKEKSTKRNPALSLGSESWTGKANEPIPESSWADLGEEDETVRRIRQLREQRKSRLEEYTAYTAGEAYSPVPDSTNTSIDIPAYTHVSAFRAEEADVSSRPRPLSRAVTESSKAWKLLGLSDDVGASPPSDVPPNATRVYDSSPERSRKPTQQANGQSTTGRSSRPATSHSVSPIHPLSLDYSYAEAVATLQGVDRELRQVKAPQHKRQRSITLDASPTPLAEAIMPSQPVDSVVKVSAVRPRPKSAVPKQAATSRWSIHHPDLPVDFERKKSRRKSMNDVRRTRIIVDEPESPQDSIEKEITEFLDAPRLSQKVQNALTGRVICFSEVGDPNGAAVFVCVGMGLTRFVTAFYDELAATLRLRLITIDRPGVGGSESYPPNDRSGPLSWPDDIMTICQHLGISQFSLLAHSAGAIYAFATALILSHLIRGRVQLLAPWIPPSQLEAISHPKSTSTTTTPAGALPRSQRFLRVLPASFLKAANSSSMGAASLKAASKRQINKTQQEREQSQSPTRVRERPVTRERPDFSRRESMMHMDQHMPTIHPLEHYPIPLKVVEEQESLLTDGTLKLSATATPTDPNFTFASTALNAAEHAERARFMEYTTRLTQRTWELATRDSNPATDLLVCLERNRDVGFRYTDVNREIVITHGSDDRRVPVANVKWLADQMNLRARAGAIARERGSVTSMYGTRRDDMFNRGGCEVRILEGEGHGLMASAPIMSDVLTEIAGYWRGEAKGRMVS